MFDRHYLQAKPISADNKEITYRSVGSSSEIHVKMVQGNVDTMEKVSKYTSNCNHN